MQDRSPATSHASSTIGNANPQRPGGKGGSSSWGGARAWAGTAASGSGASWAKVPLPREQQGSGRGDLDLGALQDVSHIVTAVREGSSTVSGEQSASRREDQTRARTRARVEQGSLGRG
ncbi:unnamed protein product, partial [Discosporangium mesarthrocarpum]